MIEIPYLKNMVFERRSILFYLFFHGIWTSRVFHFKWYSWWQSTPKCARERSSEESMQQKESTKTSGQVKPLKGDFWLIGFVDCAETPPRTVNLPQRFQAIWKNFWGCKAPLGLLEGIKNPPSVQTWNLWFLGGGFNELFSVYHYLGNSNIWRICFQMGWAN